MVLIKIITDETFMISTDPLFYLAAVPAILLTGVSKSGFGGIALFAVPIMALVISPIEAAAIVLPLLLMMDAMGFYAWRGKAHWGHLRAMLPGAVVGVIIGMLTATYVSAEQVRLFVGVLAVAFVLYQYLPRSKGMILDKKPRIVEGSLAGTFAGFTSYIAHAGSPPYHMYIIPKGLDKVSFAATGTYFFTLVNGLKFPAYIYSGQLTLDIGIQALVLAPLVPIGVYSGLWLNKKLDHALFYKIVYGSVFVIGLKLIGDSLFP
ncbi:sulfite exporter TauE/SafE family protein [Temperatibacter marinus]|uniref:Probable membrane transporter protein n=1 Tax=Temperatibacter marinus TaxID=1456591 RepID=A0AA52HB33_9PROT|nr:sulfite exporter TauE/SafE family protein [Temperatibacter marinus]WND03233.1 sulfite exporter TauE/SafE family protein [Temperatibacter marinus]